MAMVMTPTKMMDWKYCTRRMVPNLRFKVVPVTAEVWVSVEMVGLIRCLWSMAPHFSQGHLGIYMVNISIYYTFSAGSIR